MTITKTLANYVIDLITVVKHFDTMRLFHPANFIK
jgi:hypothetical protein